MKTKGFGLFLTLICLCAVSSQSADAQVRVNVNIGPPPPVIVHTPPTMILLPEPKTYVAVGVPYDIYFVDDRYYYLHGGNWFWGPGYGGPWTYVVVEKLPKGLRKYKVKELHEFRDREYKVYTVKASSGGDRYFIAEEHPGRGRGNGNSQGNNGNGRGNSKAKGKGK
jgi:hypothetical protein